MYFFYLSTYFVLLYYVSIPKLDIPSIVLIKNYQKDFFFKLPVIHEYNIKICSLLEGEEIRTYSFYALLNDAYHIFKKTLTFNNKKTSHILGNVQFF